MLLPTPFYTTPDPGRAARRTIRPCSTPSTSTSFSTTIRPRTASRSRFDVLDALADNPRVIGIKESSGILHARRRYPFPLQVTAIQLVSGSDDMALDFMLWGATSLDLRPGELHGQGLLRSRPHFARRRPRQGAGAR